MSVTRAKFLKCALEMMGTPYIYGGRSRDGLDCSGLVVVALKEAGGPDWTSGWWTDRFYNELVPTIAPKPGDLCLYGAPNDPSHVMIWLGTEGLVLGASGGNSSTTTLMAAAKARAEVKVKENYKYRPDFIGFRSLPLD